MAIQIKSGQQPSSMGRRLFAMAAPIVGGALGGPAGAAAGSLIGNKMNGASTEDAVLGAAQAGVSAKASPVTRRAGALAEDPQVKVNEGLSVLSTLPPDHPLKQELAPSFVRASMMGKKPGAY